LQSSPILDIKIVQALAIYERYANFLALSGVNQHFFHLSGSIKQPNSGGVHKNARHIRKQTGLCRLVRLVVADITM
jgi:hypothetical protein